MNCRNNEFIPVIRPTLVEFEEVREAFCEVWQSGIITVGKYTALFEEEVQKVLGVRYAIALSSCTSGLMLVLKALELTGEVIVPSFTFTATAHTVVWNRLTPVFCDCRPGTYTIDPEEVKKLITDRTSAIMPVYCFGLPPDIDELASIARDTGIKLAFDAAQGLGATYKGRPAGGFGDAEVFSLSPTKVVSSVEGGMVTTNDETVARRVRSMRDYGKALNGEDIDFIGLSARISEFHSIVGLKNLARMSDLIEARQRLIALYKSRLAGLPGISFQAIPEDRQGTGNYMVIFVDREKAGITRDELYRNLKEKGIETKKYFYPPVHLQRAYEDYRNGCHKLPVTEKAAREGLALPLFSHMDDAVVSKVCETIKGIL